MSPGKIACVAGVPFRAREKSGGFGRANFSRARKGTPATQAKGRTKKEMEKKKLTKKLHRRICRKDRMISKENLEKRDINDRTKDK